MKNLKKVLAGALAVVMALSLMTGAFAADFTDAADIDKTEAVEVMASAGILAGLPDGSYDPDGILNREQAAKMIAYLTLGEKKAEGLALVANFKDVPATNWATSYIAYCASEEIISGYAGNFFPTDELTGYAYGKMILTALGFDAAENGLVNNDDWTINVGKLLAAEELMTGMEGVDMNKGLSRENAAQLTLNAAVWSGDDDVYRVVVADKAFDFETEASAMAYFAAATGEKSYVGKVAAATGTLVLDVHGITVNDATAKDAFGRPAVSYNHADWEDALVYAAEADLVYTKAITGGQLYTDLGKPATVASVTVYLNGYEVTDLGADVKAMIASGDKNAFGGNGTVIEVFKGENNAYTVVAYQTQAGEITDYAAAELDANGDVTDPESVEVTTFNGLKGSFDTEAFDKADKDDKTVVIATATMTGKGTFADYATAAATSTNWTIQSVEVPEAVENVAVTGYNHVGTVDSIDVNKSTVTAGGAVYSYNEEISAYTDYGMGTGATYTLYLDNYGYVIYAAEYSVISKDYVKVVALSDEEKVDAFGSDKYTNVKYLDMNGIETVVKVWGDKSSVSMAAEVDTWYTVKADKDHEGYVVFDEASGYDSAALTANKLNKTSPTVANGIVANAKTVFVLKTDADPVTYKVVTGIANVPGFSGAATAYAVVENGYAVVIYVDISGSTPDSAAADELVYLLETTSTAKAYDAANDVEYYSFNAIVNGKLDVIKSQSNKLVENKENTECGAGLAKITQYDNLGYVQYVEDITDGAGEGVYAVKSVSDNAAIDFSAPTLTIASAAYLLADNAVVYMIDADDNLKVTTADDLIGNADGDGKVFMIAVSKDDATVTTIYFDGAID